jgi:hypothetical protein
VTARQTDCSRIGVRRRRGGSWSSIRRATDRSLLAVFGCARATLMWTHDGCVDHRVFVVSILCQCFEKTLPNALFRPARESRVTLSVEKEAVVIAFRRRTLLPLALRPTIPHRTRSSLHRCLRRHGISRLPQVEGADRARQALSLPRHRPHLEIRRRSAGRQGQYADRARLLEGP